MYTCHLNIYFIGPPCLSFDQVRKAAPLPRFIHSFCETPELDPTLAAAADLILLNLDACPAVEKITADVCLAKGERTELILLLQKEELDQLSDLSSLRDIWPLPLSAREIEFRFSQWQLSLKRAKDLWQAEQYLETTINNIPSLVWYKDINGKYKKVNDSFCKIVNEPKAMVEGGNYFTIWSSDPDEVEVRAQADRRVIETRQPRTAEETVYKGDEPRLLSTYISPLFDLDGSVMGTVGVGIDITQERAYEREIIRKSNTLEAIFTTLECGVLCHSLDGSQILRVNQAALNILGYASQEEMDKDGFQMVAMSVLDEDKPKLRACIRSLVKEGDSVPIEYRVLHANGEMLHVMGNVKLIRENGQLCYQRFLLDVTSQKLQEKEHARQQAELTQALSIDYSIVCCFDLNTGLGFPLRVNEGRDALLQYTDSGEVSFERSLERYIETLVYGPDQEMMRNAASLKKIQAELAVQTIYSVNYRAFYNGEMKYYEMKAVLVNSRADEKRFVLGFHSVDAETRNEMSQRMLLERALEQANLANKAKSVFLSNMSHDLRTPMNAIVGFTTLAIAHMDNRELVTDYLHKILASGSHMLDLVNDVLDMSRIESGKVQIEENPCSLTALLEGLSNMIQTELHSKDLELTFDTEGLIHDGVYCDKLRLNQVLLNILSNAVKYTSVGGHILFRLSEEAGTLAGFAKYEFRIKDDGIGISPAFLAHIFEPFEREKNTTASGVQGTGLGMAITKNIVDLMKGSIEVNSQQNVGTEVIIQFTFRLNDQAIPHLEPVQLHTHHRHSDRLLLVEDNELNQEIAAALLEDAGFTIELAENGQVAVDMLKRSQPGYYRLILMDVQMPVMNGYDATRAIRALSDPALSSIPILAMTANAFEEDKQEALRSGMNGHIAKPIDIDKLLAALDNILE